MLARTLGRVTGRPAMPFMIVESNSDSLRITTTSGWVASVSAGWVSSGTFASRPRTAAGSTVWKVRMFLLWV